MLLDDAGSRRMERCVACCFLCSFHIALLSDASKRSVPSRSFLLSLFCLQVMTINASIHGVEVKQALPLRRVLFFQDGVENHMPTYAHDK